MTTLFTTDHYRGLFDSIDQGFCTIEVLFDQRGMPYDYRPQSHPRARKQAEEALHASELKLRRSEAAHAAARGEAEQANRARDEFLAMLGHELRNPLAPMVTALQLMHPRSRIARAGRPRTPGQPPDPHGRRPARCLPDHPRNDRTAQTADRAARDHQPLDRNDRTTVEGASEPGRHPGACRGSRRRRGSRSHGAGVSNLLTNAAKYSDPGSQIAVTASRRADTVVLRITARASSIAAASSSSNCPRRNLRRAAAMRAWTA